MINTFAANEIPNRGGSDQQAFSDAMDAFIKKLTTLTIPQINAFADALNNYSLSATSTSNITIGAGIKNFVVEDLNKSFMPGMQLTIADAAAPADNLMLGTVVSYAPTTGALSVKVRKYIGSGTKASWVIAAAANAAFEQSSGALEMHATTMDVWAQPEVIYGNGAAVTMTNIAAAPQAGAIRTLYPVAGTVITHGATFDVAGNANYTFAAGDMCMILSITTTTFKVYIFKDDGTPVALPATIPVGLVVASYSVQPGFLALNGANVSRTTYQKLWEYFGSPNSGNGFDTFTLPTVRDQDALLMYGTYGAGAITDGQMPSHTHLSNAIGLGSGNINFTGTGGNPYRTINDTQTGVAGTGNRNIASGHFVIYQIKF